LAKISAISQHNFVNLIPALLALAPIGGRTQVPFLLGSVAKVRKENENFGDYADIFANKLSQCNYDLKGGKDILVG
jgi:hypothetical protein